ncbi:MAG: DUF202 domain-containing protein [Nocardioidaceae bacterium]|nr:DUF202 domain-containing protein [Nocardioidaceae bacterium]
MAPRISSSADDNDDELVHRVAALERTALAWERTGFGLASVGALLLHLRGEAPPLAALGAVLLAAAVAVVVFLAPARYRAARSDVRADTTVARSWPILVTALTVAGTGIGLFGTLVVRSLLG